MPGAHRNDDLRFCTAKTIVVGQGSVFVNGKLWAVQGDPNDHGLGNLIQIYGKHNVFVEGKLAICAVGDIADPDLKLHPGPPTDPSTASTDTFIYSGSDATPSF